jgi:hypothetical protein
VVEKIIDFAKNFNVRLSFRVNPVMYHLSPFCLILLCFSQIHYISNSRAHQLIFVTISRSYVLFSIL